MFRFTPDRVPTGPRAFFLAFTATGSVDRAGRELECVAGEAPTAALGFGPHLLWRIEPATPGEDMDMPRCSSGVVATFMARPDTAGAAQGLAGAWRGRGPYHMRMCCRRSVSIHCGPQHFTPLTAVLATGDGFMSWTRRRTN